MAIERDKRERAACLCGKGLGIESFWANDHAFASDYGFHSSGLMLECEECRKEWVILEKVANPSSPPEGKKPIYFIRQADLRAVTMHNDQLGKQASAFREEEQKLGRFLHDALRRLR